MVILKKIKASTLMETLVATVLVVLVFMISSMILNNIFSNSIKNNTKEINVYLKELQYLYKNEKLVIPFQEDYKEWQIVVDVKSKSETSTIIFEAINTNTNKHLSTVLNEY